MFSFRRNRRSASIGIRVQHGPERAHECVIVGQVPTAEPETLSNLLVSVAERFQFRDVELMGSLPHWVTFRPDLPAAKIFQRMHAGAWLRGRGSETVQGEIELLRRLRVDAAAELGQQVVAHAVPVMRNMISGDVDGLLTAAVVYDQRPTVSWSLDDYERWLQEASQPEHVTAIVGHFLECWKTGERTAAGDISWINDLGTEDVQSDGT